MVKKLGLKLKEQKGFTLIELLAVIVILGIIAAIAIPAIGNVIEKSKNDAKVAEALSIIDAARLSHLDSVGTPNADKSVYTWTDATVLEDYISKVKDTTFTVTFTVATNTYEIVGHDAAQVITTTITDAQLLAKDAVTKKSEEDLAAAANN